VYTIGELARRTGLSVRTIRFYSDSGVVHTHRTATSAGYRLLRHRRAGPPRPRRTLRDLGLDLATIRRVPGV